MTNEEKELLLSERWHEVSTQDTDIEYTRTDVFIEKACEWMKYNLPNWVDSYKEDIIIENFKKYMEE